MNTYYVLGLDAGEGRTKSEIEQEFQVAMDKFSSGRYTHLLRITHLNGVAITLRWDGQKFIGTDRY